MGNISDMIVRGANVSVGMGERMLKDVSPSQFARKVTIGGRTIDSNHPAFILGHLSLYPASWAQVAGLTVPQAAPPQGFADLFAAGKECRDDPDGSIYPPMERITSHFFTSHRAVIEALKGVGDEAMAGPNPREGRMKDMFPTLGGMLMFYATSHMMLHMGQISAWRRGMGLGPVM